MLTTLLFAALALAADVPGTVVLTDGQTLAGSVEVLAGGDVALTLADGERLVVPRAAVGAVRGADGAEIALPAEAAGGRNGWLPDQNRTRYFYSPSAFNLGKRRGYVSQKELVVTEAGYGVTDFWDVQAGTSLVTLFLENGQVALVGTKLATPVAEKVRIGAGAQALWIPGAGTTIVLPFATVTAGDADRHLSLSGGVPVAFMSEGTEPAPFGMITLSGNWRVGERVALLTENWLVVGEGDAIGGNLGSGAFALPSFGARFFGRSFAADAGLFLFAQPRDGIVLPIPWLAVTWNWEIADG